MFYLIFEYKPKHHNLTYNPWRNRNATVNRSSTHNQLELETIRKSIKSRWQCTGFGVADYQKIFWDVEDVVFGKNTAKDNRIHHFMNGHIITVEEVQDVVWFRLNFENVSKNGCTLIEIYQDMDMEELTGLANEIKMLGLERDAMARVIRNVNSYSFNISPIEQREPNFMRLPVARDFLAFKQETLNFGLHLAAVQQNNEDLITKKGDEFFKLLDSKRTVIS